MVDVLMELLQESYEQSKCPPFAKEFAAELQRFQPQAIVICLEGETQSSLQPFRVLTRDPKFAEIPVVVISEEDADCTLFSQVVQAEKVTLMPHPTDIMEIMEQVQEAVAPTVIAEEPEPEAKKPAATKAPAAEAVVETKAAAPVRTRLPDERASILVVDDDVMMLNTLKLFLDDLYEVTVVPSGKLALKFLAKKHADLVLLDYMMPEMDGPTVLRKIREESPCSEVPVLFITGVAEKDLVMRGLSHRPDGYLLKPTTREELLERVMEIMLEL